ncbi:MAG TPA: phosphoglucosamine mutase [Eubacteriaceae bacterium]|nr:phosphoglucosamine mutase [Eubacteriaceae bacterium]
MGKLFGTDGVRGIANEDLTPKLAFELGRAGAYVLATNAHKPKFIIGKDTRVSGDMLETALTAGILSVGGEVLQAGVFPTPAVALLTRELHADAGVVISASHNPAEFNGIKFFNGKGLKLRDSVEAEIEKLIQSNFTYPKYVGGDIGTFTRIKEASDMYADFVYSTLDTDLKGLTIVLDCANGAAYRIAPELFERAGATVITIGDDPDGVNINSNCGSTHLDRLQAEVLKQKADFGIAFDGDADRMLAVDDLGNEVNGDKILTIFATHMKKNHTLKQNTVVVTVMSNMGLDAALNEQDCKSVKTKVGDRYVLEEMIDKGYNLGGEQSGHIILLDHNTTGDGILSGIQLARIVKKEGKRLSELASAMKVYPQVLVNVKVDNAKKHDYQEDPTILKEIQMIEDELAEEGRVLIRTSGTEPLVRVMLEGKDHEGITKMAHHLATFIERRLV